MTVTKTVALFHSALGVREGVRLAADRLRSASHVVHIVDQYDGRTFDDYGKASEFSQALGFPALMQRRLEAVAGLPDGFTAMGFSNGAGMATFVACNRNVERLILCSGALRLQVIGIEHWPAGMPVQLHYTLDLQNTGISRVHPAIGERGRRDRRVHPIPRLRAPLHSPFAAHRVRRAFDRSLLEARHRVPVHLSHLNAKESSLQQSKPVRICSYSPDRRGEGCRLLGTSSSPPTPVPACRVTL